MPWSVDVYVEEDGSAPVEEFLLTLPTGHRAKVAALISQLKEHGPTLPFPYSSQVTGKIRELRTQWGRDHIRVLYFADPRRVFILLHGFLKRTASTPENIIRLAEGKDEFSPCAFGGRAMKTRWDRFFEEQMRNRKFRKLVEEEMANLRVGIQIAKMRQQEKLTQTQLAARAGMPSSKISSIENSPRNLTLETLVRIARGGNRELEIRFKRARRPQRKSKVA